MKTPRVKVKILDTKTKNYTGKLPTRATNGSIGWDLYIPTSRTISERGAHIIPLGIALEMPTGYYATVESRSSLFSSGITALRGIIDNDYRGELCVVLNYHNSIPIKFCAGDRIAQLVFHREDPVTIEHANELSPTSRHGGFGSTGA